MKPWPSILICCLAASCAHYRPQPLQPEQSATRFDARRLDDAGLKSFVTTNAPGEFANWPPPEWNLDSLTLVAFYFHPDLEVARAQWQVATAGIRTAAARPNPSVGFTPGYDTQIPGNYSPWLLPVTFDLPIETAGKRGKRLAEADAVAESARWNFVSAAWQIRSQVRAALVDFTLADHRAKLLQTQLAAQSEIVKLLQGRLAAGAISRPELTTAQIALNQTQLDFSGAQAKRADARSRLAEALGVPLAALAEVKWQFDFSTNAFSGLTLAEARNVALRRRADLLGALADYAAAEADLQLQVAKQWPDLHLGPGYAWNNGNAGDNQWSLGLTLELPVLDQNQGPIAEAEARRRLAAAKFLQLQAQVAGAVDRAVAGLDAARRQLRTGRTLLAAEERQEQSIAQQAQAGAADRLDLVSAQMELNTVRLAQLDIEAQWQTAISTLEDTLQSPADQVAGIIQKISAKNSNGKQL